MESASSLRPVPPRKILREGQRRVVEYVRKHPLGCTAIRLPTGYGKTLTAAACFAELYKAGVVSRLLYVVPTTVQLRQFVSVSNGSDGQEDFLDAGLAGVHPFDVGYSETQALKRHRMDSSAVFACTIQAVTVGAVGAAVRAMMETGRWMLVVDEHHHYAVDKSWSSALRSLNAVSVLAMSATPDRVDQDGAFGVPQVGVTYQEAHAEGAVKRLVLHSYEYQVDAITVNGEPISFTTSDLIKEVGSDKPNSIEEHITSRKLRWSPKYVSPLVSIPIDRLLRRRQHAPRVRFQALVGAMSCSHAQMVCEQIRTMYPDLAIDWVGTGLNGRTQQDNEAIIARFCPPKRNGKRDPRDIKLDVLVHVAMAGEGLDSVFVVEVVHLNAATISNQNDQENGRAARRIPGLEDRFQEAVINVDSSSPYSEWSGDKIMDVFDRGLGKVPGDGPERTASEWDPPLEPTVILADCELTGIDKGDPEVIAHARNLSAIVKEFCAADLEDINHPIYDYAIAIRKKELRDTPDQSLGMSALCQVREDVNQLVGTCASLAAQIVGQRIGRFEKSLIGDFKKRFYGFLKKRFGGALVDADEAGLRERYAFLRGNVFVALKTGTLPTWLQ